MLENLEYQDRLVITLDVVTGKRIGEILALRWQGFSASDQQIFIRHTLYRGRIKRPKTKSSIGPVKLPTAIVELLLAHKEQSRFQALDDFIFCREDGSPLGQNNVRCRLYRAMDAAGIKRIKGQYGFHIFRHTAGSLIYARSRDLKLVQKTLGDSDLKSTGNVYIHLEQADSERGSLIVLDEIFSNCDPSVTRKKREAG